MKKHLLLILILLSSISFAQQSELYLKTFIKKDTVQLRWAPTSAEVFLSGLLNGYQILRSGPDGTKTFEVKPLSDRKSTYLNTDDEYTQGMFEYIENFGQISDESLMSMPFAIISLGAGTSRIIAEISGVYFEDVKLSKGTYEYKVKIKNKEIESNSVSVNSGTISTNPECTKLQGESRIDLKEVYMYWEAAEMNGDYSGYYIYKSVDNKNFSQLNETALFHFTSEYEENKTIIDFVDTSVTEGMTYYYYVQPINHFADLGEQSNTIEVYIQKTLKGNCIIDTVKSENFNREIIGFYDGDESEEVSEYLLYRADKIDSTYAKIDQLKSTERTFSFNYNTDLLSGDRHYFKVGAVSVDGDTAYSFPYYHFSLDQEPPGICSELKGQVDSLGIARLSWLGPDDSDVKGFRVFRSNSLNEEFVEVTRVLKMDLFFADTLYLGSLTNEIYYKVGAIDNNYNNGPLSEPVLLLKPDTIPPVAGVFRKYKVSKEGVYLEWNNSKSSDLKKQYILRSSDEKVDTVLSFQEPIDSLRDQSGKVGKKYTYTLIAEDKSGNVSYSKPLNITYEIGYRLAPVLNDPHVDREKKIISLKWEPIEEEVYAIQIYKAKANGKFRLYKTIRENVTNFEDASLSINNEYHYKIKVMYKSGLSSKMSEAKTVMY